MQAWRVDAFGKGPVLKDIPMPVTGPDEALIKLAACGLNFADLLMQQGSYQDCPPLPYTPGLEFAGTVVGFGTGPHPMPIGTRVAVFAGSGGLAQYAAVPAARLVPIPDQMSFTDAAAFQIAYGTSHLALDHRAHLQPGETVLILGAAGGVGLTALQIAKRMGARVIACARGQDKLAIATAMGADQVIDSDTPDLKAAFKALGGVEVVYDPVGGPAFHAALSACRPEARILTIGFASGDVPKIAANLLLVKNLTVMGLYWGGYLKFAPQVLTDSLTTLFQWYETGGLRPHISHCLPFDHFPEALELLRTRAATGKVVITLP